LRAAAGSDASHLFASIPACVRCLFCPHLASFSGLFCSPHHIVNASLQTLLLLLPICLECPRLWLADIREGLLSKCSRLAGRREGGREGEELVSVGEAAGAKVLRACAISAGPCWLPQVLGRPPTRAASGRRGSQCGTPPRLGAGQPAASEGRGAERGAHISVVMMYCGSAANGSSPKSQPAALRDL
jgi:hypothetical protein